MKLLSLSFVGLARDTVVASCKITAEMNTARETLQAPDDCACETDNCPCQNCQAQAVLDVLDYYIERVRALEAERRASHHSERIVALEGQRSALQAVIRSHVRRLNDNPINAEFLGEGVTKALAKSHQLEDKIAEHTRAWLLAKKNARPDLWRADGRRRYDRYDRERYERGREAREREARDASPVRAKRK